MARYRIILLFMFLALGFSSEAQYYNRGGSKTKWVGTAGIGVGPENLVSFPKLSGYAAWSLGSSNPYVKGFGRFPENAAYVAGEASIVVFFAGAWSISGTAGMKFGRWSVDCAVTPLWLADPDGDIVGWQTTVNPKMGVMIGPTWLKIGPSFLIKDYDVFGEMFGRFMHIGDVGFNVELNFNMTWDRWNSAI